MHAYQQLSLYTKKYIMYDAPVLANTFVSVKHCMCKYDQRFLTQNFFLILNLAIVSRQLQ